MHHLDTHQVPVLAEEAAHLPPGSLLRGKANLELLDLPELLAAHVQVELIQLRISAGKGSTVTKQYLRDLKLGCRLSKPLSRTYSLSGRCV